jgi:hypothetical protein
LAVVFDLPVPPRNEWTDTIVAKGLAPLFLCLSHLPAQVFRA